uniref:Putative secreted protein n=1 Tax=Anopheles darlingi TaxID=43151 RepID=A0A2M4DIV1_ANODA
MVVGAVSAAMAGAVSLGPLLAGCCLEKVGPTGATNDSNEPFAALLDFLVKFRPTSCASVALLMVRCWWWSHCCW